MANKPANWIEGHKKLVIAGGILFWLLIGIIIVAAAAGSSSNNTTSKSSSTGTANTSDSSSSVPVTPPSPPPCTSYQTIDSQAWLEIVKDPDANAGKCITVYGDVTQFDSSTGTSGFRADVGATEQTPEYGFVNYPTNTVLTGDPSTLANVVEQDLFTANVQVLGSYTYSTQIGGQTTVPQLQVDSIQVTGSLSTQ